MDLISYISLLITGAICVCLTMILITDNESKDKQPLGIPTQGMRDSKQNEEMISSSVETMVNPQPEKDAYASGYALLAIDSGYTSQGARRRGCLTYLAPGRGGTDLYEWQECDCANMSQLFRVKPVTGNKADLTLIGENKDIVTSGKPVQLENLTTQKCIATLDSHTGKDLMGVDCEVQDDKHSRDYILGDHSIFRLRRKSVTGRDCIIKGPTSTTVMFRPGDCVEDEPKLYAVNCPIYPK